MDQWQRGMRQSSSYCPVALSRITILHHFYSINDRLKEIFQIIPQSQEIDGSSLGSHWILNMESWLLSKGQSLSWKLNARAGAEDVLVTTESYNITIHKSFVIQAHTSPCWKLSIKKNLKNHLTQNWYKCPQPPTSVSSDKTRMELPPFSVTLGSTTILPKKSLSKYHEYCMNTVIL